jgi:hypothetical protein
MADKISQYIAGSLKQGLETDHLVADPGAGLGPVDRITSVRQADSLPTARNGFFRKYSHVVENRARDQPYFH